MADIIVDVEVRENTGSGSSRAARRAGQVPGVLYGGKLGPVPVAVNANAFRKVLYSGKFLGHMVTLRHQGETQTVIAKDVQFHPVSDEPLHFDLYRVDEHQLVRIAVPVHFKNQDTSPGMKKGGALIVALHEVQLEAPADQIPEELVVDLDGLDIGASVKTEDLTLPKGVSVAPHDREAVIASISMSRAMVSEEGAATTEESEA